MQRNRRRHRPVQEFRPTEAEFANFDQYITSPEVSRAGFEAGAVLIHPPKGWKARESYDDVISLAVPTVTYSNANRKPTRPIRQKALGDRGVYQVQAASCASKKH